MDQMLLATLSYPSRSVVRKTFSKEEDAKLVEIVNLMGDNFEGWNVVAEKMKTRTARQCRERWVSYLSPNIRVEKWTEDEDRILIDKINKIGKKWTEIASYFNGRSGSDIKNRWYSHLKDITFLNEYSKIEFMSDPCSNKKKRNRKIVSAYEQALKLLETKESSQNVIPSKTQNEGFSNKNITDRKLYNDSFLPNAGRFCNSNNLADLNNINKQQYCISHQQQITNKNNLDSISKTNQEKIPHVALPPIHQLIDNMDQCLPLF
ncbi:hypothetical protein M9Y10_027465 [Tritrichomonas musculus]|uniref:Myb-like DNA-binding domain containing protein n=1 Tax=Tritrichomonas musculus TaxID=1915356 RepID=A0ABR2H4X1_9EUKA